jgi:hypothetical protein
MDKAGKMPGLNLLKFKELAGAEKQCRVSDLNKAGTGRLRYRAKLRIMSGGLWSNLFREDYKKTIEPSVVFKAKI